MKNHETVYQKGKWTAQYKAVLCKIGVYLGDCLMHSVNTPEEAKTFIDTQYQQNPETR